MTYDDVNRSNGHQHHHHHHHQQQQQQPQPGALMGTDAPAPPPPPSSSTCCCCCYCCSSSSSSFPQHAPAVVLVDGGGHNHHHHHHHSARTSTTTVPQRLSHEDLTSLFGDCGLDLLLMEDDDDGDGPDFDSIFSAFPTTTATININNEQQQQQWAVAGAEEHYHHHHQYHQPAAMKCRYPSDQGPHLFVFADDMSKIDITIKRTNKLDLETAEVDEEGMLTSGTTALSGDLLPGEVIVGQYHCETVPQPQTCCSIIFLSLITLGLYLIYKFCCRCCRGVKWGGAKEKLVVTSLGRLIVWKTDQKGNEKARCSLRCCCCFPCVCCCPKLCAPDRSYEVNTKLLFAHARDVAAMSHEHDMGPVDIFRPRVKLSTGLKYTFGTLGLWILYRFFLLLYRIFSLCCGCDKNQFSSTLTLYLSEWPTRDLEEYHAKFIPLVWSETSDQVKEGLGRAWLESKFGKILKGSIFVLQRTLLAGTRSTSSSNLPYIRVGVQRRFKYVKEDGSPLSSDEAFTGLLQLQRLILQYKLANTAPTFVRQPKAEWTNPFEVVASDCHVRDLSKAWAVGSVGTVQLGTESVALLPDEKIVNVLPLVPVWALSDCILTIFTLGLYYCFTVPKKRKTCHAVVITDKRIMDIFVCSRAFKRTEATLNGWQQVTKSYFFASPVTGGYISRNKKAIRVAISVSAGSLVFDFNTKSNVCVFSAGGNDPETAISFAYTLTLYQSPSMAVDLGQSYPAPRAAALPTRLPFNAGHEKLLYHTKNDEMHKNCKQVVSDTCLRFWTCGLRPWEDSVELVLTSERAYFLRSVTINPCAGLQCLRKKDEFYLGWVDHARVTGYSLEGKVEGGDTCCLRVLTGCFPCCFAMYHASLVLHVALGNMSSAVFILQTSRGGDDFGLMRSKPVVHLRALLSALELSRQGVMLPASKYEGPLYYGAVIDSVNNGIPAAMPVPAYAGGEIVAITATDGNSKLV